MALSKIRAPNGPVNSGLMTCFVSSVRSYRMGLSPPPIESKYRAQLVSVSFPTKGNAWILLTWKQNQPTFMFLLLLKVLDYCQCSKVSINKCDICRDVSRSSPGHADMPTCLKTGKTGLPPSISRTISPLASWRLAPEGPRVLLAALKILHIENGWGKIKEKPDILRK